jgi:hypothetical protein
MKKFIYILAGIGLFSFANPGSEPVEGIWMGTYETDASMENVVLKFDAEHGAELYRGTVDEANRMVACYRMQGDSLLVVTCQAPSGEAFKMEGHFNKRMNYLDGTWQTNDKTTGNFYLRKQKFREMNAQP